MSTLTGCDRLRRPSLAFQGKYARAEALYKQAQAIREKALGSEHPDVAQSINNLADVLLEQVGTMS